MTSRRASCASCHYQQQGRCTEPRNQNVAQSLAAGGNYEARLEPPTIQPDDVCDFYAKPMVNNYRSTMEKKNV